ncbi:hypothetical protein [Brevibacillus sp. SYSU BS000544]|uniref:hypothetical protein n=1 Tax=Brevibacillus sp. SYSU BS000544 TaxID=3416443 RepID=UPI003CE5BEF0
MTVHNEFISVKTITDQHLEEFMRCPYQFYQKQFRGKPATSLKWEEMVQYVVNLVVQDFYKLPPTFRSAYKVLELIQQHWVKKVELFDSKIHYYLVLAKITDHLTQQLVEESSKEIPAILFEKLRVSVEELQIELAMTFHAVEWFEDSYVVKRYIIEEDENILSSYRHMTTVFCNHAFHSLPERIEIVSLLSGKVHRYYPTKNDVPLALDYLQLTRNLLQEKKSYAECSCAMHKRCNGKAKWKKKEIQFTM